MFGFVLYFLTRSVIVNKNHTVSKCLLFLLLAMTINGSEPVGYLYVEYALHGLYCVYNIVRISIVGRRETTYM